jgi:catechol 2,3-dioxygenase-like lactoylglutathione lyase family enzyme
MSVRLNPMKFRLICLTALCAAPMLAQLYPPNAQGVTMGHMHLNTRDVPAQKAFFVDALGGKAVRNGPIEMVEFPGVYVLFTKADNPPPSRGSIVDHFGFTVKDMPGSIEKWKKMGLTIEPTANPNEVFVLGPEQMRIEVYGIPEQTAPITMNHIHWNIADIPGMQAWYDKMFGARAGQRDCIACLPRKVPLEEGRLAGTSLSYSGGAATLVGTKGRGIDHIGFEVKNLDAFVKNLEAQGVRMDAAVRQVPGTDLRIAFLTDPYGTYIELTEGLQPKR